MKQLLPFKVGYESYALELNEIQEIVEQHRIDPFPGAPDIVAGAIAFHGRIVPVISMPKLLNFPMGTIGSRLIVLVDERGPIALGVDQVGSIINLEPSAFNPVQSYSERKYISDVVNWRGAMLGLLQLDQIQTDIDLLCDSTGG
jgi:purine-binding chemotaxis protein CheW